MVTEKCSNWNEHIQIKIKHDKVVGPFHIRRSLLLSEAAIPCDNKVSALVYILTASQYMQELKNLEDSMKWLYEDEGLSLSLRGVADSVEVPYSKAIKVNWESLGLVKIDEVDFDTFRTLCIPDNITIDNVD